MAKNRAGRCRGQIMFEWLEDEMAEIKTPKFHLMDGPASPELRQRPAVR